MITKHPWFGPKQRLGWGWTPVSWEGWAVTLFFIAVIVGVQLYFGPSLMAGCCTIGAIVLLLVVCFLTGTKPGGPGFNRDNAG